MSHSEEGDVQGDGRQKGALALVQGGVSYSLPERSKIPWLSHPRAIRQLIQVSRERLGRSQEEEMGPWGHRENRAMLELCPSIQQGWL